MTNLERRAWEWGLAVAYIVFTVIGDFSNWLTGKPKVSVQDVIGLSTFFVLLGIGGLLFGLHDLSERIGPPRQ